MQIDHIQLAAPEGSEEVARQFFIDLLEMEEVEKPEALRARGGCWFRADACSVHVGSDPHFAPQRKAHAAFLIDDTAALAHRLEAAGYPVSWDGAIAGVDRFYSEDPFGNRLEFIERARHPPTAFLSAVPHLDVEDVVQAADYYRDLLGFDISGYWDGQEVHEDPSRPAVFGIVHRGEIRLHFNLVDRVVAPSDDRHGYDVYFHVVGVDQLAEDFARRGATILEGPEDRAYDQREVIVRDLYGRILAFGEDTS